MENPVSARGIFELARVIRQIAFYLPVADPKELIMSNRLKWILSSDQKVRHIAHSLRNRRERQVHRSLSFGGNHTFVDRQKGAETLVMIVAGYKPVLWAHTVPRFTRFIPNDADVCYVSPGIDRPEIRQFAEQSGWSYLVTKDNRIAQAKNHSIEVHPHAQWLVKLDEDIFLTAGTLSGMKDAFYKAREDGYVDPGYVSPVLNVNGHAYTILLEKLGLKEAYQTRFGEYRSACMGVKAYDDKDAATWLWKHSTPLDNVAHQLEEKGEMYSVIPHRFSIGALAFERSFWEEMNGFHAHRIEGHIGYCEEIFCEHCTNVSRPGIVAQKAYAGHFSFYKQNKSMEKLLKEEPELFALPA